ncbi:MAG TPA: AsmA family protein [Terracidiphilus sp.]|nr:AsmA family protein [Terracidiphilus sp.]
MHKHWVKIALGCVALFVLALIALPFLINANDFRPTIQTQLTRALGRPVTFGDLSLSLFKGSLVAKDISVADDPAFSTSSFLRAESLEIGVEMMPLIRQRQVRIIKLVIDKPSINLLHADNGRWNFSSMGNATGSIRQSPEQVSSIPDLTVGELDIRDGSASVSSIPAVQKPFVYSAINLNVKQFSFLQSFPFALTATLPASGSLDLSGNAGPLSQKNAAATPFQAKLNLKGFDPVASGVLESNSGIAMKVDLSSDLVSDGSSLSSRGKILANNLQLTRTGAPAPHPVNIDYDVTDTLDTSEGKISNVSIHAGAVAAKVTGTYHMTPKALLLDLRLAAPGLPIDQVEDLLPTFGVRLPTGSRLTGGTLTANLAVSGPAATTTVTGPIEIDNTKLEGFDIGSRIQGLNLFKSGGGTTIQTLRTTVNSSPQTTQFSNVYGNLPQIGTATGGGSVSPTGALDFKMVATLSSNNAVGAVANQAMNTVQSYIGGFLHPNAKPAATNTNRGIPLTITGSTSNPSIRANVLSMLK